MTVLLKDIDGPVLVLTMNRPERRNALNRELCEALLAELKAASDDETVRAIVLMGAGPSFCGGADVADLRSLTAPGALHARAELTAQLLRVVAELDIPVIAAVHGAAVGAGAGLALSCDGIVMADDATLGFPELQHGIPPLLILPGLQRHIGAPAAFEVLTRGKPILAQQALERHWVGRVVSKNALQAETREWALQISEFPRKAVMATKRLARETATLPLGEALAKAVATYR